MIVISSKAIPFETLDHDLVVDKELTVEITSEDWVQIIMAYADSECYPNEFPQFLEELIELKIAGERK